jgi:hypothetical protein
MAGAKDDRRDAFVLGDSLRTDRARFRRVRLDDPLVIQLRENSAGVYKVDRLTRSLADFARMVEIFDVNGVSFVAVTQQFNTTTSMGRLTLNVLLSFAQFELLKQDLDQRGVASKVRLRRREANRAVKMVFSCHP